MCLCFKLIRQQPNDNLIMILPVLNIATPEVGLCALGCKWNQRGFGWFLELLKFSFCCWYQSELGGFIACLNAVCFYKYRDTCSFKDICLLWIPEIAMDPLVHTENLMCPLSYLCSLYLSVIYSYLLKSTYSISIRTTPVNGDSRRAVTSCSSFGRADVHLSV